MTDYHERCIDLIVENKVTHEEYRRIYNEVTSRWGSGHKYIKTERYKNFMNRKYQIVYETMRELSRPDKIGTVYGG